MTYKQSPITYIEIRKLKNMDHWNSELDRIKQFDKLLDEISPLPSLSDEELWKYSETVIYIQDLLSLVASLPSDKKPPIF